MIVDKISGLSSCACIKEEHKDMIQAFVNRVSKECMEDGKYELLGEELYALLQTYDTRELSQCKMESHMQHFDLQYIVEGQELVYCDFADELVIAEDCRPDTDALFYAIKESKIRIQLQAGMFVLFACNDAHRPCCMVGKEETVRKIVFKIKQG